jgi:arylsulfatase A-like enzyme
MAVSKRLVTIFILVVSVVLLFFIFSRVSEKSSLSMNLIALFDSAEKENFNFAESIDSLLPDRGFSLDGKYLHKKLAILFSNNTFTLHKNGNQPLSFEKPVKAGGFRFVLDGKVSFGAEFLFKIKQSKMNDGLIVSISAERENLVFRIVWMDRGVESIVDEFPYKYPLKKQDRYVFITAFFKDYFLIFDGEKILFQMKDRRLGREGGVSFIERDKSLTKTNYILKFAAMNSGFENDLIMHYEKKNDRVREHRFNYLEHIWIPAGYRQFFTSKPSEKKYVQRLKLNSESRQVIYFKLNSSLKYNVKIPQNGSLEFSLAVVPKYLKQIERLVFRVKITPSGGSGVKEMDINLKNFKYRTPRFENFKFDLSEFAGKKCSLDFRFDTVDGEFKQDEEKILLVWGSPAVYVSRKPGEWNVILISLDTLRADHLGCYGYNRETSPNIDRFAANSTMFINAASCSDWTLPSHLSLFTGLYPSEAGILKGGYTSNNFIAENAVTIAEYMRDAGFKTAGFHGGGYISDFYGFDKGFDFYRTSGKSDAAVEVDEALDWIRMNDRNKFFVFFHTYEIHGPYTHDYFLKNSDQKNMSENDKRIAAYDSDIRYTDIQIGRFLDSLKKLGLSDKTILILTSDHGENFNFVNTSINSGRHGRTLYESEVKIPLIIGGIDMFNKPKKIRSQVSSADLLPTLCGIFEIPLKREVRGIDLQTLIKTDDFLNRIVYMDAPQLPADMRALRSSGFKLIKTAYTIKTSGKKKINTIWEFYNLKSDHLEKKNIWSADNTLMQSYSKLLMRITSELKKSDALLRTVKTPTNLENKQLQEELKALGYLGN